MTKDQLQNHLIEEAERDEENINWEQRKYETAKDYAIGLMTSKWYDGTEQQAIERGIEFAENFIECYKD